MIIIYFIEVLLVSASAFKKITLPSLSRLSFDFTRLVVRCNDNFLLGVPLKIYTSNVCIYSQIDTLIVQNNNKLTM